MDRPSRFGATISSSPSAGRKTPSPEQLWRIDQLTDGTWRILPKAVPDSKEPLALTAIGDSTPTLAKFDSKSDNGRWNLKKP